MGGTGGDGSTTDRRAKLAVGMGGTSYWSWGCWTAGGAEGVDSDWGSEASAGNGLRAIMLGRRWVGGGGGEERR